jgi:glyoxylase-like metal-dependent hydrolase (beta-lactamase superfamily II)
MTKLSKRLLVAVGVLVGLVFVLAGAMFAFLKYSVLPLRDAHELADGAVTTVVTDYFGPVAIGAYLFKLNDGGLGLVDTGSDPNAEAIRRALTRSRNALGDVRAVFITHGHADHVGGAKAFPNAKVYVLEADADTVPGSQGLRDGAVVDVSGTRVEVFAIPGHTRGSAAVLVHGVLFLGDSAAAAYDGSFQPNTMMGVDTEQTVRSLRSLAERLKPRRAEIRTLAFGHQGPLDGPDPLLSWAVSGQ